MNYLIIRGRHVHTENTTVGSFTIPVALPELISATSFKSAAEKYAEKYSLPKPQYSCWGEREVEYYKCGADEVLRVIGDNSFARAEALRSALARGKIH